MFVDFIYNTGVRFLESATDSNDFIGDGRVMPDANQLSGSVTQNSGLVWVAITCVSVKIKSSITEYDIPLVDRYCVTADVSQVIGVATWSGWGRVSSGAESKFISENVGMSENVGTVSDMSRSKSTGNGSASDSGEIWDWSDVGDSVAAVGMFNADVCCRPRLC